MIMETLTELAKEHGANKLKEESHHYLPLYERYLRPVAVTALLEIGVQKGGSLKMWADYLVDADAIHGVDIKERCKAGPEAYDKRIKVFVGDQSDEVFLEGLGNYDVIIDDGSHVNLHQRETLKTLWSHVNPGGLYVVEDLHTSYWPEFGGNFYARRDQSLTMIELLKGWVDILNGWARGHKRTEEGSRQMVDRYPDIAAIHFHRSICFLEKAS